MEQTLRKSKRKVTPRVPPPPVGGSEIRRHAKGKAKATEKEQSAQERFHFAACSKDVEAFTELMNHPEVDVNYADELGCTALHLACFRGALGNVKALVDRPDVNVNAVNKEGHCPLFFAMGFERHMAAKLLLRRPDIDLGVTDKEGRTALDVAKLCELRAVEDMIRKQTRAFLTEEEGDADMPDADVPDANVTEAEPSSATESQPETPAPPSPQNPGGEDNLFDQNDKFSLIKQNKRSAAKGVSYKGI